MALDCFMTMIFLKCERHGSKQVLNLMASCKHDDFLPLNVNQTWWKVMWLICLLLHALIKQSKRWLYLIIIGLCKRPWFWMARVFLLFLYGDSFYKLCFFLLQFRWFCPIRVDINGLITVLMENIIDDGDDEQSQQGRIWKPSNGDNSHRLS